MNASTEHAQVRFTRTDGETWYVCHTRPRCEKKLAALFTAERMMHYLPLVPSIRHYRHQTKRFTKPLFPGYVFARVPNDRKARIYQQELIARTILPECEDILVAQLHDVRRVVEAGLEFVLHPILKKGMRVKVASGPLRGLEGIVDNPASPQGIVVSIDVLQRGLLVKLSIDTLETLS